MDQELHDGMNDVPATEDAPSRNPWVMRALIALGVLLVAGLVYYFVFAPKDPQSEAWREAQRIVAAVSKLMVLPADEEPIIATVADPSQLADQPFFANARVGDKVLIYNLARKAILYSEAENRIVDVAPLSPGQVSPAPKK